MSRRITHGRGNIRTITGYRGATVGRELRDAGGAVLREGGYRYGDVPVDVSLREGRWYVLFPETATSLLLFAPGQTNDPAAIFAHQLTPVAVRKGQV